MTVTSLGSRGWVPSACRLGFGGVQFGFGLSSIEVEQFWEHLVGLRSKGNLDV